MIVILTFYCITLALVCRVIFDVFFFKWHDNFFLEYDFKFFFHPH